MKEIEKLYLEAIENSKEMSSAYDSWEYGVNENKAAKECSEITENLLIEFAEWKVKRGIKIDYQKEGVIYWMKFENASHKNMGTTKELLNLFIQEKYGEQKRTTCNSSREVI